MCRRIENPSAAKIQMQEQDDLVSGKVLPLRWKTGEGSLEQRWLSLWSQAEHWSKSFLLQGRYPPFTGKKLGLRE